MYTKAIKIIMTIVTSIALLGCSTNLAESSGDILNIQVNVDGVTGAADILGEFNTQRAGSSSANISRTEAPKSRDEGGFMTSYTATVGSIGVSMDPNPSAWTSIESEKKSNNSTISRATTPMAAGYTFRILLYNSVTGELWRTIQAAAGSPATLDAERGASYTWYAYSYNNNEEIPAPSNLANPTIETSIEKSLMYATGQITIPASAQTLSYALNITFQHKVAQLRVKVDATSLALYARINNLNASFDNNAYIKKGVFNIRGNRIDQIEVVPTETIFNAASATNTWEKSYYTVDPQALSSYRIIVNDLPVTFSGVNANIANRNLATYFGAANRPTFPYNWDAPAIGQRLNSNIFLNYQPSALRILHISSADPVGYSMQLGPSWDFLNSKVNFGDLPESVVKIGSWTLGGGAWEGGTANNNTANWISAGTANGNQITNRLAATNTTNRPDIVVIGYDLINISTVLGNALNNYINDRGVVVMMLQDATNATSMSFFNTLFGVTNINFSASGTGGAMYPIEGNDPNDVLLNGPFGDLRTRHWGEDRGTTLGLTNIPASQATIYSRGNAINRTPVATARVTMFKHNTKSFFFVGDGGFVAYSAGAGADRTGFPFLYNPITKQPLPKAFGNANASPSYVAGSRQAYNSIVIANVMAWAVKKAELEGIRVWKYAAPPAQ